MSTVAATVVSSQYPIYISPEVRKGFMSVVLVCCPVILEQLLHLLTRQRERFLIFGQFLL